MLSECNDDENCSAQCHGDRNHSCDVGYTYILDEMNISYYHKTFCANCVSGPTPKVFLLLFVRRNQFCLENTDRVKILDLIFQ